MNERTVKMSRYRCPDCYQDYDSMGDLIVHRQNVHGWKVYNVGGSIEQRLSEIEATLAEIMRRLDYYGMIAPRQELIPNENA